jgi:GT2 family glycosyltransferase|tara:strand:- start:2107 stop:3087 length:981 start_codon:yes stop_codon:yes gene_type:complete
MSISNILVLTVTYGDRFDELKYGPLAVAISLDCHIVIVCNGVSSNYLIQLKNYIEALNINAKLIINECNLGSAGGFKKGIESCTELFFNRVLILDDDNFISPDSINAIDLAKLGDANFIYRKGRKYMDVALHGNDPASILSANNGFLGLNIVQQIQKRISSPKVIKVESYNFPWSPYGGLLLSRKAITSGILPNKDYFLYCDDTAYTNDLSKEFGLYIVPGCEVSDYADSWNVASNKNIFNRLLQEVDSWRIYYSVRNQCHFDLSRCDSKLSFILNMMIFIFLLSLFSTIALVTEMKLRPGSRFFLIVRSSWDGLRGSLGNKGVGW